MAQPLRKPSSETIPTLPEPPPVEALGDRIAELSAQIQAATFRLLQMIRDFDDRHGWACGFRSCAHWLNWRTGLELGAAREKVRVARALGELPRISEYFSSGELSYSKVRALTRVATPVNEEELLAFARAGTAAHVEKLVRTWRRLDRLEEAERDAERQNTRSLTAYTDDDGMLVLRGRLDPEAGALLLAALEAASERLYQEQRGAEGDTEKASAEQRRADALALIAESALAHALDPGPRSDRYQVVLHVDAPLLADPGCPGLCHLEEGPDVSAETSRRFACDATTVTMKHGQDGQALDDGRKRRTISSRMRRALTFRDGGCRFPGCSARHCEGHHVQHWADGGPTRLANLLSLCKFHHRALHEGGFKVALADNDTLRVFLPDGRELPAVPPPPRPGEPLAQRLAAHGTEVDAWTAMPSWQGERVDWGAAIAGLRG